jgi:hypothetical protein
MNPARAHSRGVRAADVRITSTSDRHGGEWVAVVDNPDRPGGEQVVASFYPRDLYGACRWLADLNRLES